MLKLPNANTGLLRGALKKVNLQFPIAQPGTRYAGELTCVHGLVIYDIEMNNLGPWVYHTQTMDDLDLTFGLRSWKTYFTGKLIVSL